MTNQLPHPTIESLEDRRLLSGVTLLIHGFNGNITGWVDSAATAIAKRLDGQASQYVMKVDKDGSGDLSVTSFNLTSGPNLGQSTTGEVIIKVDWSAVDEGSFSTNEVGGAVSDYLMRRHGSTRAFAEMPIHLIGHSRGASMVAAISRDLGRRGAWVDQDTFLDPHPVDGEGDPFNIDFGDTAMRVYDNVLFADNYWRSDGNALNLDPDGEHVDGAHEGQLNNIVQKKFVGSAHAAVTAYYHGTIDLKATTNGDHPVLGAWYGNTSSRPARSQTGFVFSQIGGGSRPSDGSNVAFGGKASRVSAGQEGTQWANLAGMRLLQGTTIPSGPRATLHFVRQDRDSADSVVIFLDRDKNPYNGNNVRVLRRATVPEADGITTTKLTIATDRVSAGSYYIGTQIFDQQGHLRIGYTGKIKITKPSSGKSTSSVKFSDTPIVQPPATQSSTKQSAPRISELVLN